MKMASTPDSNRKKQKADVSSNGGSVTMKSAGMNPEQATHIARFAAVANRYCVFVEQEPPPEKQAFVLQAAGLLTELYSAALPLSSMQLPAATISEGLVSREQTA